MLTKIDKDNKIYQKALIREGKFWKGQTELHLDNTPKTLKDYKLLNETGGIDRFDYIQSLGNFKNGLSIGCGSARYEIELLKKDIVKKFTFIDISDESFNKLRKSLPNNLKNKVKLIKSDLNFINLKENEYDFIFCANVLHHLINLEYILLELNKSLTGDGIIFVDDYIGENRFQFSDKRIRAINETAKITNNKIGIKYVPMSRTNKNVLINSCPFEAIRSEDIMPLLNKLFEDKINEKGYGSISSWMSVVINFETTNKKDLEHAAEIFVEKDKKTKNIHPLYIVGFYKKNNNPPNWKVNKWDEKEIKNQLPLSIFNEGLIFNFGNILLKIIGRGKIYNFIKKIYFKLRS